MSASAGRPAPPALGHYRQAVLAEGATVHIAGQVAVDAAGETVGVGDAVAQAKQVAGNLTAVLNDVGLTVGDVVSVRVYATARAAAVAWAEVRLELFAESPPASTLLYVSGLAHSDWLLEVDAVASVPDG